MSDRAYQLLAAPANGPDHSSLHKVLSTASMATGRPYVRMYEDFMGGVQRADSGTVYSALEAAGIARSSLDAIAEDIDTLHRLDTAKRRLNDRAVRTLADAVPTEHGERPVGPARQVTGVPISDEDYARVREAHPKPDYKRLRRARRLPGGANFEGPDGEHRFANDDTLWAEAGSDLVATREQGAAQARVTQAARAQAGQLDAAIKGDTPAERRRSLDAAVRSATKTLDHELGLEAESGSGGGTVRQGGLYPVRTLDDGKVDEIIAASRRMRGK